jgi:hypothetical protein
LQNHYLYQDGTTAASLRNVAQENTQKIISVIEALWAAYDIHDRLWSSGVM